MYKGWIILVYRSWPSNINQEDKRYREVKKEMERSSVRPDRQTPNPGSEEEEIKHDYFVFVS